MNRKDTVIVALSISIVEVVHIMGNLVVNTTVPIAAWSYGLGGNLGPTELFDLPSKAQGTAQTPSTTKA